MSVRLSAGAEQKGSKTEEGELGSNLGPDSSEYRLKCRSKTQKRAKRFNKIDNQKLVRDRGSEVQILSPRPSFPKSFEGDRRGPAEGSLFVKFRVCPKLCPLIRSSAERTASSLGWTYRADIATELWPAIRTRVQASHPDSPSLVRNV